MCLGKYIAAHMYVSERLGRKKGSLDDGEGFAFLGMNVSESEKEIKRDPLNQSLMGCLVAEAESGKGLTGKDKTRENRDQQGRWMKVLTSWDGKIQPKTSTR